VGPRDKSNHRRWKHWLNVPEALPLQNYYDAGTGVCASVEGEDDKDYNPTRFIKMCTETDRFLEEVTSDSPEFHDQGLTGGT